ncbi:MAG: prepilin-type N-terminal cleavage/methylation domain-containing protein, partial [Lachnospiraceae bacterium]|nr:prepilin-type N-terminal cleavage/methylation domain-containing protein [Lachnospiraceae bacterium]
NNQGFSLVELIIVIAIMAVLIGVLAPQFIKYVERSRVQKDASAVEEVRNAVEIALSNDAIYQEFITLLGATGTTMTVTIPDNATMVIAPTTTDPADNLLLKEIADTVAATVNFTSNRYATGAVITITVDRTTGSVSAATTAPAP